MWTPHTVNRCCPPIETPCYTVKTYDIHLGRRTSNFHSRAPEPLTISNARVKLDFMPVRKTIVPKATAGRQLQRSISEWLGRISRAESPPCSVVAFNIGLFESDGGFKAYLIGADHYDLDSEDWACDESYTPGERYLTLPYEKTKSDDWEAVQHLVSEAVRAFLETPDGSTSFLAKAHVVTVGFDDGNLSVVSQTKP